MSISLIPKARPGITKEDMTWNELFYYCLQKNMWIVIAGGIFLILLIYTIVSGLLSNNIFGIVMLLVLSLGIVYMIGALPASIIYATVIIAKRNKAQKSGQ